MSDNEEGIQYDPARYGKALQDAAKSFLEADGAPGDRAKALRDLWTGERRTEADITLPMRISAERNPRKRWGGS